MAIPISFVTAVLTKNAIDSGFLGGLTGFLKSYPDATQDDELVGVAFMSGGELQEFVDSLTVKGFDVAQGVAVGEMFHGEWEACDGIEFVAIEPGRPFSPWQATAVQGKFK